MLSADFSKLGEELRRVEAAGADWVHIDVMDGMFVPNLTIGPLVVKALRPLSKIPFDVHLMIQDPIRYVEEFAKAGADMITIHTESKGNTMKTIKKIRELGKSPGISLNPGTPFSKVKRYLDKIDLILIMTVQPGFGGQAFREECVQKISRARKFIDENNLNVEIVIDGGINRETGKRCVDAGATVLAAGSSLFSLKDMEGEITLWRSFGSGQGGGSVQAPPRTPLL
jgi:ribulose-phosphate 3-epimerase